MYSLIKLIGYYKNEKDPEVVLEVLDAIKWTRDVFRNADGPHSFEDELKIYRSLNGLKKIGDETISKRHAKSDVALMLLRLFSDAEAKRGAFESYNLYEYDTPAFLRSAVFLGLCQYSLENFKGPSQNHRYDLNRNLQTASLPEERSRNHNGYPPSLCN